MSSRNSYSNWNFDNSAKYFGSITHMCKFHLHFEYIFDWNGTNVYSKIYFGITERSSRQELFCEKGVHRILQNSRENTCARVSFLIKTLAQVFSCEFCEISKNTFSYRTPLVAASVLSILTLKQMNILSGIVVFLPDFLIKFWKKKLCVLLCSISKPNFIAWLPLVREILGNMCTVIIC